MEEDRVLEATAVPARRRNENAQQKLFNDHGVPTGLLDRIEAVKDPFEKDDLLSVFQVEKSYRESERRSAMLKFPDIFSG